VTLERRFVQEDNFITAHFAQLVIPHVQAAGVLNQLNVSFVTKDILTTVFIVKNALIPTVVNVPSVLLRFAQNATVAIILIPMELAKLHAVTRYQQSLILLEVQQNTALVLVQVMRSCFGTVHAFHLLLVLLHHTQRVEVSVIIAAMLPTIIINTQMEVAWRLVLITKELKMGIDSVIIVLTLLNISIPLMVAAHLTAKITISQPPTLEPNIASPLA